MFFSNALGFLCHGCHRKSCNCPMQCFSGYLVTQACLFLASLNCNSLFFQYVPSIIPPSMCMYECIRALHLPFGACGPLQGMLRKVAFREEEIILGHRRLVLFLLILFISSGPFPVAGYFFNVHFNAQPASHCD